MTYKYEYTRLLVPNFKACFQFYRDVMGFKPTFGTEEDVYADFATGTQTIALCDQQRMSTAIGTSALPAESVSQDKVCLVFGVENVDAVSQQLKMQAVPCVTDPADHPDWGIRAAHFRDPAGNLIEIYQSL